MFFTAFLSVLLFPLNRRSDGLSGKQQAHQSLQVVPGQHFGCAEEDATL